MHSRLDRVAPREYMFSAIAMIALAWMNFYIIRGIFHTPATSMASMHGFWMALAERGQWSWFKHFWWPYWNGGMPLELTYAPLVPAATAAWSAALHVPIELAFNAISGLAYLAGPLTLFWAVWMISRSLSGAFISALLYSLTAPTQILVPDGPYSLQNFWQARRLFMIVEWDETPHLTALAFLPLSIALMWRAIVRPHWGYSVGAVVLISAAAYASAFAPIGILMAAVCLIASLEPAERPAAIRRIVLIGLLSYGLAAAALPPSLIKAIAGSGSSIRLDSHWSVASFTTMALVCLGWTVLWPHVLRIRDPRSRFLALFTYLTFIIPALGLWKGHLFLPQPGRYTFELEMALCVALVFGLRPAVARLPRNIRVALAFVLLSFAAEQVVSHRAYAKRELRPQELSDSIEYRATNWAQQNLPGLRLMLPGSIAQWAVHFAPIEELSGGSWSQTPNRAQQVAVESIFNGGATAEADARVSLAWLKAFGVGAIAMSAADSAEFWHPYAHPSKFDGILPRLWSEKGVTFYRVSQRAPSLAHVIPKEALVQRMPKSGDKVDGIECYDAALDDPSLPVATFEWKGTNHIRITSGARPGQVISIQVSYHPGWHARSGGRTIPVHSDGLGLIWLESPGQSEILLDYDGGFELRFCRWLVYLTAAAIAAFAVYRLMARTKADDHYA